ncbi:hypothetical protein GGX14DRAFT_696277 [Mycena pura]|uniref:Uncharacterized protein n=1 Tax=Mycena pura TaxID=153505 RepID=A0AAD6VUF8_9AGAR|nr:hypothetical protein GGX14DRAFT_696277 [Mycena pura]
MNPFMTPNGNRCPYCGNQLVVKVSKTGDMPNSRYIRCTNPHQSNRVYFHRFPPVPAPANMAPPSLHSQPPPAPLAASPSLATASTYSVSKRMTCSAPGCMSSRLDTGCCRLMCRKHCNQVGPCALKAHEHERVRKSQTAALPTAVPPAQTAAPAPAPTSGAHRRLVDDASHDDWVWSQTTTSSPPPASGARRPRRSIASTLPFTDYSSLDDWFTQTLPPVLALEARQQQCDAETSFLDELPGVKSPTPETESIRERYEREEREDAARLELGLRLSQDQTGAGPSRAPSPHPASTLFLASPPSPRPLSSSPDFPDSLLPLVSHKGKVRATKTRPAPAPLRITTQMNSDWMSPSPPTFHVKKKAPASTRSFVVVYWVRPNVAHRTFVIEDVPAWPRWRICEATGRFAELLGNGAHVELYFPKFTSWAEVTSTFVHTVTTDCVVMLRRAGVDCLDLERTICKFYPQTDVVHIRKNLPGERTALRRMYKHGRTIPMDDSDVEVVSEKKRIKTEDNAGDELPRRQRPRLHIEFVHPSAHNDIFNMSIRLELRDSDLVAEPDHFPDVRLLGYRSIEKPLAISIQQLGKHHGVAVLLAEGVLDVVLVEEMEHVDGHADIDEPRPFLWVGKYLLSSVAIGVIDEVLRLDRSWD